jgi:tetraprenyl-beta-curcumene synthase
MRAFAAAAHYLCHLVPLARREIGFWRTRAQAIRDPLLRGIALAKIDKEGANVEAAVFFATLASREWRVAVTRIVTFQLAYEYLDGLNEQQREVECGRRLHSALRHAIGGPASDHGGGRYLQELVDACRAVTSPSNELLATVERVGEAQARNHAGAGLKEWAQRFAPDLLWWEAAAAGISSLDILALLACPVDRHRQLPDAYVEVCALSALLDGLVDIQADIHSLNHNFARHYANEGEMAGRLQMLTRSAARSVRALPDGRLHALALAGLIAHNLAAPSAAIANSPAVRGCLLDSLPWVRPTVGMLRLLRTVRLRRIFY